MSRINQECLEHKIKFYVITQQAKSSYFSNYNNKSISYQQEMALIKEKLDKYSISYEEIKLLTHSKLMEGEKKWAHDNNVNIIDGIKALDQHRNELITWVHLSARGNYMLANEIANRLWETNHQFWKDTSPENVNQFN